MSNINEQIIWDYLTAEGRIENPVGVAGLMGNIKAESSFNPRNLNNTANRKLGMTDEEYTVAVDSGKYSNFIKDGYDYGLCQWVYHTRKKGLYDLAKSTGRSVGDLELQLDFLWQELQAYSSVLKVLRETLDIREATEVVLKKYEKPANQSDAVLDKRTKYASEIFDKQAIKGMQLALQNGLFEGDEGVRIPKKIRVTGNTVNIRYGDSTDYADVGHVRKDAVYDVAAVSADTGWYAIRVPKYVVWISPKYVEPIYEEDEDACEACRI